MAISEHACLAKQSAVTTTCAVGAAGEGLFSRLVNSGEVGVGTTGFTSGGTSMVSSPVTCKNYVHNTGSLKYFTYYVSLSASNFMFEFPCILSLYYIRNQHDATFTVLFINTFTASYLNTQGLNNSCLKSPASTLVDLTFQSRALRSCSLNQLRNLSL